MKKIIKSLVVVVAVATVASIATWSYFTDQVTVAGNTFSAGELDFTLNGDVKESHPVILGDLEPGADWSNPYRMKVWNKSSSTMDMKYKFYDQYVSQSVSGFYNKLKVKVVHGHCDGSKPGDVNPTYTWIGNLADLNYVSTAHSIGGGKLEPNITHCFALYFKLDPTANNTMQGATAVADIVVDGTQFINPGWTE